MAKRKPGVYETLEYLNSDGTVYKTRKAKWLGECPNENVFAQSIDALEKKMKAKHIGRMNMVERSVNEPTKVVIDIKMFLVFEYDQRWTYEWVQ